MSDYIIRKATEKDLRFVVKTWVDGYRASHSGGLMSLVPMIEPCPTCAEPIDYSFAAVMPKIIMRILKRPGVTVFVASNPREKPPLDLHAWIAVEEGALLPQYKPPTYELQLVVSPDPLVHYVHVKKLYREQGLATQLMKAAGIDPRKRFLYTCQTALSVALQRNHKMPLAIWAPLNARFEKEISKIHEQASEAPAISGPGAKPDPRERVWRDHEAGRRG